MARKRTSPIAVRKAQVPYSQQQSQQPKSQSPAQSQASAASKTPSTTASTAGKKRTFVNRIAQAQTSLALGLYKLDQTTFLSHFDQHNYNAERFVRALVQAQNAKIPWSRLLQQAKAKKTARIISGKKGVGSKDFWYACDVMSAIDECKKDAEEESESENESEMENENESGSSSDEEVEVSSGPTNEANAATEIDEDGGNGENVHLREDCQAVGRPADNSTNESNNSLAACLGSGNAEVEAKRGHVIPEISTLDMQSPSHPDQDVMDSIEHDEHGAGAGAGSGAGHAFEMVDGHDEYDEHDFVGGGGTDHGNDATTDVTATATATAKCNGNVPLAADVDADADAIDANNTSNTNDTNNTNNTNNINATSYKNMVNIEQIIDSQNLTLLRPHNPAHDNNHDTTNPNIITHDLQANHPNQVNDTFLSVSSSSSPSSRKTLAAARRLLARSNRAGTMPPKLTHDKLSRAPKMHQHVLPVDLAHHNPPVMGAKRLASCFPDLPASSRFDVPRKVRVVSPPFETPVTQAMGHELDHGQLALSPAVSSNLSLPPRYPHSNRSSMSNLPIKTPFREANAALSAWGALSPDTPLSGEGLSHDNNRSPLVPSRYPRCRAATQPPLPSPLSVDLGIETPSATAFSIVMGALRRSSDAMRSAAMQFDSTVAVRDEAMSSLAKFESSRVLARLEMTLSQTNARLRKHQDHVTAIERDYTGDSDTLSKVRQPFDTLIANEEHAKAIAERDIREAQGEIAKCHQAISTAEEGVSGAAAALKAARDTAQNLGDYISNAQDGMFGIIEMIDDKYAAVLACVP